MGGIYVTHTITSFPFMDWMILLLITLSEYIALSLLTERIEGWKDKSRKQKYISIVLLCSIFFGFFGILPWIGFQLAFVWVFFRLASYLQLEYCCSVFCSSKTDIERRMTK